MVKFINAGVDTQNTLQYDTTPEQGFADTASRNRSQPKMEDNLFTSPKELKYMVRNLKILLLTVAVLSVGPASVQAVDQGDISGRWSTERACQWYQEAGVIKGCNYLPRSAVNMTEMWQAPTFDPKTVGQELGWAQEAGYNSVRVFLQYLVWKDDADGLKKRIKTFLTLANEHNISVMLILFCDCSFAGKEPYLGPQDAPVPGVHNSGWVPSPGLKRVTDRSVWPDLERYVKDIVGAFGQDPRILIWDLYNEPGNSGMGLKSLPLAEAAFAWAREVHPIQPLTTGVWTNFDSPMSKRIMALSDIISFHGYDQPDGMMRKIMACRSYGRPVICTEWLRRQVGNTVAGILPLFAKHQVGWYHWGLVAGRTQTYMHWGSKRGDPMPEVWQHDTFHQDGTPYNLRELELIRAFRFPGDSQTWNSVYLQNDCIRLQVVPECGGRIMQYSLGEHDFFWNNDTLINVKPPASGLGPNGQWLNYGGEKLWPAPQGWDNDEQWPGPPDAVLDGQPYTLEKLRGKRGEAAIRLTSRKDQRSGIQFSRVVRLFEGSTRVNFEATMKNIDTRPRRWGIWSHTQLDGGKADGSGHNPLMKAWCPLNPDSRFPKGYSVIFGKPDNPTFQPDTQRGLMQVQYQYKVGKIGLDSHAGWVATVNGESGAVFVQRFVFEPDKEYPDGSSVEFWLNGLGNIHAYNRDMVMPTNPEENPYVFESEVLSPFAQLQPGQSYIWSYDWYAANIGGDFPVLDCSDAGIVAEPLSAELSWHGLPAHENTAKMAVPQAKLKGRFGVFVSGAVRVEFADAQGRTLQTLDLPLNVSPFKPVVLDNIVAVPADAASVRLVLIGADGKTVGELAKADLSKTEAGACWSPEKAW